MSVTLPHPSDISGTGPVRPTPLAGRALGVLAAVAGRFGWRLWWPTLPWLLAAGLDWLSLSLSASAEEEILWTTTPSGVLLLASLAAVGPLWWQGARYALGLGHSRRLVFAITWLAGVLVVVIHHAVCLLTNQAELAVLGERGIHVFPLEVPLGMDKFGSNDGLASGTWVLLVLFGLPVLLNGVLLACGVLAWGARALFGLVGLVAVGAGVALLASWTEQAVHLALAGAAEPGAEVPFDAAGQASGLASLAVLMLYLAGLTVSAWLLFRRARV